MLFLIIDHDSKSGTPIPLFAGTPKGGAAFTKQIFIWSKNSKQIVGAGSGKCLTVGNANYDATRKPSTNKGTLEHEVWSGPLTAAGKSQRKVVALFNKGESAETLAAPASVINTEHGQWKVRDIVARMRGYFLLLLFTTHFLK